MSVLATPVAGRAWSAAELGEVRRLRRAGATLETLAKRFATSRAEIDLVLWELLGSDPGAAAAALAARRIARSRGLPARIARLFR